MLFVVSAIWGLLEALLACFLVIIAVTAKLERERSMKETLVEYILASCTQQYPLQLYQPDMHGVWKSQKKVSFNIASEASYVYILSGQKFIKNAQKWSNLASFWKPEACGQPELPDRSVLIGRKLVENAKIQVRHFRWFWNTVCIV